MTDLTVRELETELLDRFPIADAEDWDHVGLSVGDPSATVRRVACALDPTEANVRLAAERGCNVLLTHHPVYLEAPAAFTPADAARPASGAAVYTAIELGVAVISLHTNLDRSLEARELLPRMVGLSATSSLEHPDDPSRTGLGAICEGPDCSLGEFAEALADAFGTEPRAWGAPEARIDRVAFMGGSLGHFGDLALAAGAQAVVCGEAGYHVAQDLALRGCPPVLLGHDRSEEPFTSILRDALIDLGYDASGIEMLAGSRLWWTTTRRGA